jgi:glycosyltransferase involved in cell wall biosynthesis
MITPRRCLSVAVPCFDEADTVATLVATVLSSPWTAQVIVVDDGSTDGTAKVLSDLVAELDDPRLDVVTHEHNRGKGAALRSAFSRVTGEYVVVQDADLEYDPGEYGVLLEPLERGVADVVFGSRFLGGRPHRVLYFWHSLGNRVLTLLSNMFTDLNLTDMESCYKCFRREVVESFTIREDRFGVEPELTARVAGGSWRIFEVGISYSGRTYAEGKKIGWRDGIWAAVCIIRYSPVLRRLGRGGLTRRSSPTIWGRSVPPDDLGKL